MTSVPPSSPFPGGSRPSGGGPGTGAASQTPTTFIGRYQVLEKIGEGGMGSLYLARDPAIDRLVAIKLLRRGFDTEAVRERFAREARAAGRLRHPNIVTIFDVGEHDGDPFIAMEFLAGETLGELIRHGAGLSISRRLKLLEELCDGLAYAHRAGLVHRDIKPANLMVDAEGVLKILDFGIVRVGESGMTAAGVLVGTINYMSPEQVLGTGVDHRSDIFAVGLVAYELLSGRQAFPGTIKDGLLKRIPDAEVEPLAQSAPGLDPDVVAIVEQALKKDPSERYQELARMRNDLARARQRIEVEEERAAAEAAARSAETAFISQEPTAPGVPVPQAPPSTQRFLADAERALADGHYRVALTIAGRAAALDPRDRTPSVIVARAEAGLLERGRTVESIVPLTPSSGAQRHPSATPAPSTATSSQRVNYLAIGVALLALLIAGAAIWVRVEGGDPAPAVPSAQATRSAAESQPGASNPPPQSPAAAAAPPTPVEREASGPPGAADPASGRGQAASPSSADTRQRQPAGGGENAARGSTRDTRARSDARGSSRGGANTSGRQPAVESPPSAPTPPPAPSSPPGKPLSTLPGSQAPRPQAVPPPKPETKPPEAKPVESKPVEKPTEPAPPPRDLRAEAIAEIRAVLARYEAAWEALNFEALAAVWALSGSDARNVRRNMDHTRSYEIEMSGCSVEPGPDLRRAAAVCVVSRRFQGEVSGAQSNKARESFQFEKRGERWMITAISTAR